MTRTVLTVSGRIPPGLAEDLAAQRRPRPDYVVLAEALGAELLDVGAAEAEGGRVARLLHRFGGAGPLLAWELFRRRRSYDAVVTDGEQVGLPYAVLTRLVRRSRLPRHHMIVHILSVPKKSIPFRALRLRARVDSLLVYSEAQERYAVDELRVPAAQVHLMPFMVDSRFFRCRDASPPVAGRPVISSAGLEFRDYATLIEATRDLDVEVVIAAASPWSQRRAGIDPATLPPHVTVCSLDHAALRDLYERSTLVVVPLHDVPFQAGITTILEAMAMARPVICSRTAGQTDTVEHDVTGVYVPPAEPAALRREIERLLHDADARRRLGGAARSWIAEHGDIERYAERIAGIIATSAP